MKETVETTQETLDIKKALENDEELTNEHIYQNVPVSDKANSENPNVPSNTERSDVQPVKSTQSKGRLKKLIKWFVVILFLLSLGVLGIWVYANKAVLFPSDVISNKSQRVTSVDEGGYTSRRPVPAPDPYVTKRDLREASRGIREDLKLALKEYSKGLDRIDQMQGQMSAIKGQFNELKTLVAQSDNNGTSAESDRRYDDFVSKLMAIDESLKMVTANSEKIIAFEKVNKDRKTLENQFKNNDWDLRKRMMVVEQINGIDPKNAKKSKTTNSNHKTLKASKYSAYMTSTPTKKTPKVEKKIVYEKVKIDSSKAVVWKNKHRWKIRMISNALTQVQNIDTKRKLTISEGVEISGCGIVLDIAVSDRRVTTQHCIISVKGT